MRWSIVTGPAARCRQAPRGEDSRVVNFWDSLTLAERQAFTAVSHERTFARGATLMQEGEQANYVMVIRAGWTQIAVKESGGVRVIAERGPGQLVGERGALRVNVRSATVIALETVHALVMRTEDFASFISAHPSVLEIVESQIYDRLTEDPTGYQPGDWPGMVLSEQPGHASVQSPPHLLTGENCTVLRTDVVAFGALNRNDRDRRIIRRASLEMMQASLGHLWDSCISEDRGDGLLIVVPPMVPTTRIMERLDRELPRELLLHNRTYSESVRIKLRVAANVGPVMGDLIGVSGEAIIRTARLNEAPVLKEAMASADASLGIIVSAFIYDTVIRHAAGLMDVDGYEEVEVNVKESHMSAWMRLVLRRQTEGTSDAPEANVAAIGVGSSRGAWMMITERHALPEQTRARYPDTANHLERSGARIYYEVSPVAGLWPR
jgi:hypothetical protein